MSNKRKRVLALLLTAAVMLAVPVLSASAADLTFGTDGKVTNVTALSFLVGPDSDTNEFFTDIKTARVQVDLYKVEVEPDSPMINVALMDSGFADKYDAMVIAIEREGHFILNPSARITFQPADLVWFVAQKDKAEYLMQLHAADLKTEFQTG